MDNGSSGRSELLRCCHLSSDEDSFLRLPPVSISKEALDCISVSSVDVVKVIVVACEISVRRSPLVLDVVHGDILRNLRVVSS
jgi:hypothetical protein